MPNPNIGTFDMETYKDLDSNSKVYALGFATLQMLKEGGEKNFKVLFN